MWSRGGTAETLWRLLNSEPARFTCPPRGYWQEAGERDLARLPLFRELSSGLSVLTQLVGHFCREAFLSVPWATFASAPR